MAWKLGLASVVCCTPVATPEQAGALAAIFKALADPHRVRIVNLLDQAGRSGPLPGHQPLPLRHRDVLVI